MKKINIYDYTFKRDANNEVQTGLLAQEVYEVFPQSVVKPRDNDINTNQNPWMVDYGSMTPLIIKAVQELSAKVEKLEKENEELREMVKKKA